jgi:hypothetical protein
MKAVTAIFETPDDARKAIAGLEAEGLPSSSVSVILSEEDAKRELHDISRHRGRDPDSPAAAGAFGALTAGMATLGIAGAAGLVVAGPWLALLGAAAGGYAGSLLTALGILRVQQSRFEAVQDTLHRGGVLLSVQVDDDNTMPLERIFQANGAREVFQHGKLSPGPVSG